MLILVPPSEGKTPRHRGRPVSLETLAFPELTQARVEVLEALAQVSAGPDATAALGVSPRLAEEVALNTRWRDAPATPVMDLFTGVLFDALGYASLSAGVKRRARTRLVVFAAPWGVLTPADAVPGFRCTMSLSLPGIGRASSYWKVRLAAVLDPVAEGRLVVDCRSQEYRSAWPGHSAEPERTVVVRPVVPAPHGARQSVSHNAKQTRGLVTRALLESGKDPRSVNGLVALLGAAGIRAEPSGEDRDGRVTLDVWEPS